MTLHRTLNFYLFYNSSICIKKNLLILTVYVEKSMLYKFNMKESKQVSVKKVNWWWLVWDMGGGGVAIVIVGFHLNLKISF